MDGSIYQVLGTLTPSTMNVRILTSKHPTDFVLETKKFTKQHAGFSIEIRATKDFHDRFIILDRTRCYLLGASIKDAGNKGFTIVPLQEQSIVRFIWTMRIRFGRPQRQYRQWPRRNYEQAHECLHSGSWVFDVCRASATVGFHRGSSCLAV
jgi:hypothetical protein